jgi:hypothetical protein
MHVLNGLVALRGVGWVGQQLPPWGQQALRIVVHGRVVQADDETLSALEASLNLPGLQLLDKLLEDYIELCCGNVACILWWVSW